MRVLIIKRMFFVLLCCLALARAEALAGEEMPHEPSCGSVLAGRVSLLEKQGLNRIEKLDDWEKQRDERRRELREMLGLDPMPARTDLQVAVTETLQGEGFHVEKLHFQSIPKLYVTGNLYLPDEGDPPFPAVLYVCGHAGEREDGVSYGNKVIYQHHPAWFARHGIACLILDTLQLGEIEGTHHGTYREGMWWWVSRGYTPAGVEAWNGIRALDLLQSRPEIDGERIAMTGRSGGGATTWWVSALDERVQVAVPVAGITDLRNHVVDGCVEGHCDCMYMVNRYGWDFPMVAALVAPRPLLLENSDHDRIFPLDGVMRIYWKLRHLYDLYEEPDQLGLVITPGPHKDTQDLQIPAFRWIQRWLGCPQDLIQEAAIQRFEREDLRVFHDLPEDAINATVHEVFVPKIQLPSPPTKKSWETLKTSLMEAFADTSFAGWPLSEEEGTVSLKEDVAWQGGRLRAWQIHSEKGVLLDLWLLQPKESGKTKSLLLRVLSPRDWEAWEDLLSSSSAELPAETAVAIVAVRGIGSNAWPEKKMTHIRRRYVLVGQTLDGMRVWDVRQAVQFLEALPEFEETPLSLSGEEKWGGIAAAAALFEDRVDGVQWTRPNATWREGPIFMQSARVLQPPQMVSLLLPEKSVWLQTDLPGEWQWASQTARAMGCSECLRLDPQPEGFFSLSWFSDERQ